VDSGSTKAVVKGRVARATLRWIFIVDDYVADVE
jgi:hypothetical protein